VNIAQFPQNTSADGNRADLIFTVDRPRRGGDAEMKKGGTTDYTDLTDENILIRAIREIRGFRLCLVGYLRLLKTRFLSCCSSRRYRILSPA
jgi:hypothetical protein